MLLLEFLPLWQTLLFPKALIRLCAEQVFRCAVLLGCGGPALAQGAGANEQLQPSVVPPPSPGRTAPGGGDPCPGPGKDVGERREIYFSGVSYRELRWL